MIRNAKSVVGLTILAAMVFGGAVILCPQPVSAEACTSCGTIPCGPVSGFAIGCWCTSSSNCKTVIVGGGGGMGSPTSPPESLQGGMMTLHSDGVDFIGTDSISALLANRSGWTINVDSSVDQFTVSDAWIGTNWYDILTEILDGSDLYMSTNSADHIITIVDVTP